MSRSARRRRVRRAAPRPGSPITVKHLTTREVSVRLRVSDRQVRRMIREGELPATRQGKEWDVAAASLDTIDYLKGRHQIPREPRASRMEQSLVATGSYRVKDGVIAFEMTRICRQLYPGHTAQYDLGVDGQPYRVSCTALPSAQWWRDCERAAIRFVFEMDGGRPRIWRQVRGGAE